MKSDNLLRLYPRAWRERYGEEFLALLDDRPLSLKHVFDVVAGAADARLAGWRSALAPARSESQGGAEVLETLKLACQNPYPVTTRHYVVGTAVMLGLTAVFTLIGVGLDKTGHVALGQFVMWFAFFVGLQAMMLFTFLRGQPARVQAVLTVGPLVLVAGILGTSIWMAILS